MSQPAVSEAVAGLENVLGVRLLDRGPRGAEPTIYAHALLKRANVVFDELKQAVGDIEFLVDPTVGETRIGCPESLAAGFVPAIIDRITRQSPKVTVHVLAAQTGEQEFRELRERSVDLSLGRLFRPVLDDDIAVEPLCEDVFSVVAGVASPWARRRSLALEELIREPWILFPDNSVVYSHIAEGFRRHGLQVPQHVLSSHSMQLRFHLLTTGRFLTLLHGSVMRFNAERWSLKSLPVDLRTRPMPIALFSLKNRTLNPAAKAFADHARAVARSMADPAKAPRSAVRPG
jgi:DNA-binding transcriptional LysR family regulator